jgi:hypothetical protein
MRVTASAAGPLLFGSFSDAARLTWVDHEGNLVRQVGEPVEDIRMFRLSPDGRRVALQRRTGGQHDLWLADTERGVPSRLTASRAVATQPVWSPDGRMIVYTHLGSHSLFRKGANGAGNEEIVLQRPNEALPTDWSGDGRWVLLRERAPETQFDSIWKVPMRPDGTVEQGAAPAPYLRTRFNESAGRFAPGMSPGWVAYVSDESGPVRGLHRFFPEAHAKVLISDSGGVMPSWRADGRERFYVSPENKVMTVSLKLTAATVEASAPRELFRLALRSPAGGTYAPASDGQRFFVLTTGESAPQPLDVIVNWTALIRRGAAAP